jgi:multidrug efflux pump subunit AcrA (membrane-fusion protein)
MNRWLIAIALLALVLVCGAAYWYFSAGVPVQTARVERGEIQQYVDERGKTRLSHTYDITMPFAGRIETIDLSEGDAVEAGQIVAQVAGVDLANEVAEAQAVVERLQAAIEEKGDHSVERRTLEQAAEIVNSIKAAADAADAQTEASKKRKDYDETFLERTRRLHQKNARTEEEFELAEVSSVESHIKYQQSLFIAI